MGDRCQMMKYGANMNKSGVMLKQELAEAAEVAVLRRGCGNMLMRRRMTLLVAELRRYTWTTELYTKCMGMYGEAF